MTENGQVLPFASVIHNPTSRQLAVVIRGTLTAFEWGVDFT